ncbi:MAG: hypothetical protein LUF30_12180 [Lachnospiraceae bacterium]|nr:hypothetical protein [Lachnospiraceae bacterium]
MMELFMGSDGKIQTVNLPHDAMIYQERRQDTANAHQTGFYPGGEYTYIKQWEVPEELEGQTVILEFEGVADTCRIYFNGILKAVNSNPYRGIFVDVSDDLNCGAVNEIKVEVHSVEQFSRWYSGAGIYRPVNVWVGAEVHIPVDGVKITTTEVAGIFSETAGRGPAAVEDRCVTGDETDAADRDVTAVIEVSVPICNRARARNSTQLRVALCEMQVPSRQDAEDIPVRAEQVSSSGDASRGACASDSREVTAECLQVTIPGESTVQQVVRLTVDQPLLWSDETPNLYTCRVEIAEAAGASSGPLSGHLLQKRIFSQKGIQLWKMLPQM